MVIDSSANYAGLMHRASYLVVENKGLISVRNVFLNGITIVSVYCHINCFPVAVLQSPGYKGIVS